MMSYCVNGTDCPYRTDAGYCEYTGCGCFEEILAKSNTVKIPDESEYIITKLVDLSDESIKKIADVVVKKLHQPERSGYWINDGDYGDNHLQLAYRCSNCDEQYISYPGEFKYCPNCGMKMVYRNG